MARFLRGVLWLGILALLAAVASYLLVLPRLGQSDASASLDGLTGNVERGKYLVTAGGCIACHTDLKKKGKLLAGGAALKTPFGTFYAPNITPDRKHGIGGWSSAQFAKAMLDGIAPDGSHYFPSFPYTSYTAMKAQDVADIKTYLDTIEAVSQPSRLHELVWPFSDRNLVGVWKELFFRSTAFAAQTDKSATWNRGAYLVNVLGHCGECHTQRNLMGGRSGVALAGNSAGPEGAKVPGIRGLTERNEPWSKDDVLISLQVGMIPSGDFVGGTMAEVVAHSTGKLTPADQAAIAEYLISLK